MKDISTNGVENGGNYMLCKVRDEMKFGDFTIPAGTLAEVINTPKYREADIPGLHLELSVSLLNIAKNTNESVLMTEYRIINELDNRSSAYSGTQMIGIVINTDGTHVYMDAGDKFYREVTITKWKAEKVFDNKIPENITPQEHSREYGLRSIIDYLEDEFADWVLDNCHFRKITKREIENNEGFDGAEPGDRILSDRGLEQFYSKQKEYQNKLERIGFTYDFKGGLNWE